MRTRIWNNLANIKFKSLYCAQCCRWASTGGRLYSFVLSAASATSVAAWAIWKEHPELWATIVGVAQLLHIAKPHIAFIGKDRDFLEMSYEFDNLYLKYERLWYDYDNGVVDNGQAEKQFYALRQKAIDIDQRHKNAHCPRYQLLKNRIEQETYTALELNFEKGVEDERS